MNKQIVLKGPFENVIEIDHHYYLVNHKDRICVMPFTLSTNNLLDKIGVVEDFNYIEEEKVLTLLTDYVYDDDSTDLVAANRILFEIIGTNVKNASNWIYLGTLFNNLSSYSLLKIYAVNITDVEIKEDENVEEKTERKRFKLLDSGKVTQSDDMTFLASYFRLFHHVYTKSNSSKEL